MALFTAQLHSLTLGSVALQSVTELFIILTSTQTLTATSSTISPRLETPNRTWGKMGL